MELAKQPSTLLKSNLALLATLALGAALPQPAAAEQVAIVTGYQVGTDDPPPIPFSEVELAGLAQAADIGLSMTLHHLGIDPGTSEYDQITAAVDEFFDATRPQDQDIERESFVILYQQCMMHMRTPTRALAIRIPPGGSAVYMEGWDSSEQEGFAMELNTALDATTGTLGRGWESGINMTPTGEVEELLGYEVEGYRFSSSGGLGGGGTAAAISGMVSVENSGEAWVSEEVPGIDIVRSFYDNFSTQIAAAQGEDSMFGGMMKNMVGMLQHGMPLYTKTDVRSRVAGQVMSSGTSESWITGAWVITRDSAECGETIVPEGAEVMQISSPAPGTVTAGSPGAPANRGMAGAGGPTGAGGSSGQGGSVTSACDCSCAAFEKIQEMGEVDPNSSDPETRALAMCMMQCMQQFMACAMQGGR